MIRAFLIWWMRLKKCSMLPSVDSCCKGLPNSMQWSMQHKIKQTLVHPLFTSILQNLWFVLTKISNAFAWRNFWMPDYCWLSTWAACSLPIFISNSRLINSVLIPDALFDLNLLLLLTILQNLELEIALHN